MIVTFKDIEKAFIRKFNGNSEDSFSDFDLENSFDEYSPVEVGVEIPVINYVYDDLKLDRDNISIEGKRIMMFILQKEKEEHVIVICNGWEMKIDKKTGCS